MESKAKRAIRNPSGFDERDDDVHPIDQQSYGPLDPSITM